MEWKVSDGVTASFVWGYAIYISMVCVRLPQERLDFFVSLYSRITLKTHMGLAMTNSNFPSTPNQSAAALRNKIEHPVTGTSLVRSALNISQPTPNPSSKRFEQI
jgi:hypothetical protein